MDNFGYNPGVVPFRPAANIERTMYGTTVVRVADDRPSRPQMMMPFLNAPPAQVHGNNAFKFHTVRASRLGAPVAITIEPPPMYNAVHTGFPIEQAQQPPQQWVQLQSPQPQVMTCVPQPAPVFVGSVGRAQGQQYLLPQGNTSGPVITDITEPVYRPTPGRMVSHDSSPAKTPIETYAPRSFASDGEDVHPLSKKQQYHRKKKEKKQREKVIVISKVAKEPTPKPQKPKKKKKRVRSSSSKRSHRKRQDSTSSESSSSESESSDSSEASSSDSDSDDEEEQQQKDKVSILDGSIHWKFMIAVYVGGINMRMLILAYWVLRPWPYGKRQEVAVRPVV